MTESKTKQSEQEMKVSATELKQKGSESAAKEKANKHQYHMENFYKSRARPYPVMPMVEQPESRPLEKGIKNVRRMKERFSKAKIEGVNAIKEAWSKHGHAKKKTNHCKETHEVCGKIHAASAARQVQAAQAADAHTASLETNCAKTVAFAKEAAEELTYHVCAAAAAKMDGLIKTIQNDFEYTNVTILPSRGVPLSPLPTAVRLLSSSSPWRSSRLRPWRRPSTTRSKYVLPHQKCDQWGCTHFRHV